MYIPYLSYELMAAVGLPVAAFILLCVFGKPGLRTLIFNAIFGLPALAAELAQVLTGFNWGAIMPPHEASIMGLVILVLNTALRFMSNGPVGGSK